MCGGPNREHYAKSDAWKRALPGFVPALEALPGLSREEGVYALDSVYATGPYLQNNDDDDGETRECAACLRMHSRATCELVFRGVPYEPDYRFGTKCAARSPFAGHCACSAASFKSRTCGIVARFTALEGGYPKDCVMWVLKTDG